MSEVTKAEAKHESTVAEAEAAIEAVVNPTEAAGKPEAEAPSLDLRSATVELVRLRRAEENLYMEQAKLFAHVKDGKLYEAEGLTWTQYCTDVTKYHYTSVVRRLRVYRNPATREACAVIGFTKALAVANLMRNLDGKIDEAEAESAQTEALEAAKTKTASGLRKYCQSLEKRYTKGEGEAEAPTSTLEALVDEKKALQKEIKALEAKLATKRKRIEAIDETLSEAEAES